MTLLRPLYEKHPTLVLFTVYKTYYDDRENEYDKEYYFEAQYLDLFCDDLDITDYDVIEAAKYYFEVDNTDWCTVNDFIEAFVDYNYDDLCDWLIDNYAELNDNAIG